MYGMVAPRGMSSRVKSDYLTDPQTLIAQELMKSGSSTAPVATPLEGIARALTGMTGAYQQKMLKDQYSGKDAEYNKAVAEALTNPNVQTGIAGGEAQGPNMDGSAGYKVAGTAPGIDTAMANLRNNPAYANNSYLQDYATELQGKGAELQMKNQAELQKDRQLYTDPQILAGKLMLARASRPVTNVNMTQEKEEDKAVGKAFGEQYVGLQKNGMDAPGKIAKYDRLDQMLQGIDTGTFKGTTTDLKAAAKGVGINIEQLGLKDDVAPVQAARALTNAMALELRNPSGGAGMPGALSDSDRKYLTTMVPGIETTKEGRALMTDTAKKLAQRDQEIAQLARNYRAKNGKLDEGFYDVIADYSNKNPLFKIRQTQTPKAPSGNNAVKFLGFE